MGLFFRTAVLKVPVETLSESVLSEAQFIQSPHLLMVNWGPAAGSQHPHFWMEKYHWHSKFFLKRYDMAKSFWWTEDKVLSGCYQSMLAVKDSRLLYAAVLEHIWSLLTWWFCFSKENVSSGNDLVLESVSRLRILWVSSLWSGQHTLFEETKLPVAVAAALQQRLLSCPTGGHWPWYHQEC